MKKLPTEGHSQILVYQGKLMEVLGFWQGDKIIIMTPVKEIDKPKCESCGRTVQNHQVYVAEGSLNFQNDAEPVLTITEAT